MNNYIINKTCPVCHNDKVELSELGTEICTQCRYVIPGPTDATNSISNTNKYCPECKTPLEGSMSSGWWECPNCHYRCMDYIGDLPKDNLFIPCDNIWGVDRIAVGKLDDLMSNTLQFDRCERIIFRDKTLDFVFEIPDERYKDIDTIIVNGHKFVREKSE